MSIVTNCKELTGLNVLLRMLATTMFTVYFKVYLQMLKHYISITKSKTFFNHNVFDTVICIVLLCITLIKGLKEMYLYKYWLDFSVFEY